MKKTIQPTFNEVEYNSIVKLSKEQGFSTPSGLVKYATMQYVNSFHKDTISQITNTEFKLPSDLNENSKFVYSKEHYSDKMLKQYEKK
jgi:hypothetical protein